MTNHPVCSSNPSKPTTILTPTSNHSSLPNSSLTNSCRKMRQKDLLHDHCSMPIKNRVTIEISASIIRGLSKISSNHMLMFGLWTRSPNLLPSR